MKLSVFLDKTKCKLLVTLDKIVFNNVPSKYDMGVGILVILCCLFMIIVLSWIQ